MTLRELHDRTVDVLITLVIARHLGHGRRLEFYLALVALLSSIILFWHPAGAARSHAMAELFWQGLGNYLFVPPLVVAAVSMYGLWANVRDWPLSRPARFLGAAFGLWIWFVYAAKLYVLGNIDTFGFSFSILAAFFGEVGVMFMVAANLPRPGARGNMGV